MVEQDSLEAVSGGHDTTWQAGEVARRSGSETRDEGLRSLTPGASLSGVVDFAGDTDRVRMNLQAGTYLISLTGTGASPLIDPYLRPVTSGLAHDDDGGTGTNSLLTFTVTQAGIYTFDLGAYPGSGLAGGYTVHLEQMGADSVPGTPSAVEANLDGTTFGFLETENDVDAYHVTLEAGVYYSFELAGGTDHETGATLPAGEMDMLLGVGNGDGQSVFWNDDLTPGELASGGGFLAETSGDYYVYVRSNGGGRAGYELSITATDPGETSPLDAIDWGGPANVAQDGPLNDGVFYVYFAAAGEIFDGATSLGWTAYERQRAIAAFSTYSQFADVRFAATTNQSQATFTLVTVESDEFLGVFNPPGTTNAGVGQFAINGSGWDRDGSTGGLAQGGYGFSTMVHEFGHALGLAHPHDDGGGSDVMLGVTSEFGSYGLHDLNQGLYTVMSYNDGWSLHPNAVDGWPVGEPDDYGYAGGPMALDIAVIQEKYGAVAHNEGDTTYALAGINRQGTYYTSIWDTGGTDTIRYNGSRNATIDLTAATLDYSATGGGVVSYVAGVFGGLTIAGGVMIENARGGGGHDQVAGNSVANALWGMAGDDSLDGRDGDDTLNGGDGDDYLLGARGNDKLVGGLGHDALYGGEGSDALSGSDGYDEMHGGDGIDTLLGGDGNDSLYGDLLADTLNGGAGNDQLDGGEGDDTIVGGLGTDWLDGRAGTDTLNGGEGDDDLNGGAGADRLIGGAGNDVYWVDAYDRVIELADGGVDTVYTSFSYVLPDVIENAGLVEYTLGNLTGNAANNFLGGSGADNVLLGNAGNDTLSGGMGADVLDGGTGADHMMGGDGDDIYYVDDASDYVYDILGRGNDTVYSSVSFVLAVLGPGSINPNEIERLVLTGSANLSATGQFLANTIEGNAGDNRIDGQGGNDKLFGNDGADYLIGGAGVDRLNGSLGDDRLDGGEGADRLYGGAGRDRLTGGSEADVFEFRRGDSSATRSLADAITDFSQAQGDRIQLDGHDADSGTAGVQAFTFIGNGAFTGVAGQLHYLQVGDNTFVEGDTDGNGAADFAIRLTGLHTLAASDFLL